jgi:hypothetical protein
MTAILVGADPEVFVQQQGIFRSAYNLIKGDKKNPQRVNKGAVQVDGMALEFNIEPAANADEFLVNIDTVFNTLRSMVPDYDIAVTPVAHFDREYFNSQPEAALELGCDPDYSGWSREANPKPSTDKPMRTASGHVHVGWGNDLDGHFDMCCDMAKQLDFFLALPSLVYDDNTERRTLYGAAGAFRVKPYGFEYRTLSNAWLRSPELIKWVFRNTHAGFDAFVNGNRLYEYYDVQDIVKTSDVEEAVRICKEFNIELPNVDKL